MKAFADLVERLVFAPSAKAKVALMTDYFRTTRDPDRGIALAILTDAIDLKRPTRRLLSDLVAERLDPFEYGLSRAYVGDTAETVALLWPEAAAPSPGADTKLATVCDQLTAASRGNLPRVVADLLDSLDATGRLVLLKLLAGDLATGVTSRLAKTAAAALSPSSGDSETAEAVDDALAGFRPPYLPLFAWLERRGPRPSSRPGARFRPLMQAQPLTIADLDRLNLADYLVEWKWDGLRVELATGGGRRCLYTRDGDDIGRAFPDVLGSWPEGIVADGLLLVVVDGRIRPFNALQLRLNRRLPSTALQAKHPAHIRLHDLLMIDGEDIRHLPLDQRRQRLESWHRTSSPPNSSLSELVPVADPRHLAAICTGSRGNGIDGVMLKRAASPYLAGRPDAHWFKLKRPPLRLRCVVLYARRGSGRLAAFHSELTLGIWRDDLGGRRLVPIGKAVCEVDEEQLSRLEQFVREQTRERFGPVRSVNAALVVETAFDDVQRSSRHKAGIIVRRPRVIRILWEDQCATADDLSSLERLIDDTV